MQSLILLNKPQGLTPLQTITLFREQNSLYEKEKMSFAGRLDPMAEGLLLILTGDENKKRHIYEELPKTYEFRILIGISTDTYDCLGRIEKVQAVTIPERKKIKEIFSTLEGPRIQAYPPYSSKTVNGKPLYYWARAGKLSTIHFPTKKITIDSLSLLSQQTIKQKSLIDFTLKRIAKITGDFRQENIKKDWLTLAKTPEKTFPIYTCTATVSSGTYIRALCHQIGKELGYPALALSIKRTRVGEYTLDDAIILS